MSAITIRPVRTKRDEKVFIKFQWKPYEGNPYWVPPLLLDRRKLIDRKKNPFYQHARMELFLAEKDGRVVGRIGAIVNDNHNREQNENIGFFGFFEVLEDQAAAFALFDAAKEWLRGQGVTAMRGPASPSVNDEYGMLVEGFDRTPAILMSYNPPYYARFAEAYGLVKAKDLYTWYLHSDKVFSERFVRVSEAAKKRQGIVFRPINMKDFDNEVAKVHYIYSRGWQRNWGEVPLTDAEFDTHVARAASDRATNGAGGVGTVTAAQCAAGDSAKRGTGDIACACAIVLDGDIAYRVYGAHLYALRAAGLAALDRVGA